MYRFISLGVCMQLDHIELNQASFVKNVSAQKTLPWIRFLIKHCEEVNGNTTRNNCMADFYLINLF